MTVLSCGLARTRNKLKLLYLHNNSAYDHKSGTVVTYLEGLQAIMSNKTLISWSYQVM